MSVDSSVYEVHSRERTTVNGVGLDDRPTHRPSTRGIPVPDELFVKPPDSPRNPVGVEVLL